MSLRILGLSGSLRSGSINTTLVEAFGAALPEGVTFVRHDYSDVPLYNADLPEHPAVAALQQAIRDADAVVIATPEYNHSVPGVLKNALDWGSRPMGRAPFTGKPTAVISASPGSIGGARAQQHLKAILLGMGAPVFPHPELVVGGPGKFEDGALVHTPTLDFLERWAGAFVEWLTQ